MELIFFIYTQTKIVLRLMADERRRDGPTFEASKKVPYLNY
jgi:hypothetical protein